MINDYFLLPSNIKVKKKNQNVGNKNLNLKYNENLSCDLLNILVLDKKKKFNLSDELNLNDLNILESKSKCYKNLKNRLSNICNPNKNVPFFLKGNKPKIMAILNVTEDSFFDGGRYFDTKKAISKAYELIEEGADIIDVGGESTRPGAKVINQEEEIKRILPVIKELCKNNHTVSCDTRNSKTMQKVLDQGVKIINDVSALNYDKNTINVIKKYNCFYILMHSIKNPQTMQLNPEYENVISEMYSFFLKKINILKDNKIKINKIMIDPGIGFGKNDYHNFQILKYFSIFLDLGLPILIGLSRKSFIGRFIKNEEEDRLACSLSLAVDSFLKGASFIRVHDVKATKNAINIFKKANI